MLSLAFKRSGKESRFNRRSRGITPRKVRSACNACNKSSLWKKGPECEISGTQPRHDAHKKKNVGSAGTAATMASSAELGPSRRAITFHMVHLDNGGLDKDLPRLLVDDAVADSGMS